jgi:hypothetical protein
VSSCLVKIATFSGPHIGRADENLDVRACPHAIEVDERIERVAQRIYVERIRLVGAEAAGDSAPQAEHAVEKKAITGGKRPVEAGSAPEGFELVSGTVEPTLQPALHHHDGVEGAGARTGDRFNGNAPVFEEGVEHTPREGAVRPTTLQGQRHCLLSTRPGQATGLAGMAASALRAVLLDAAVTGRGLGHGTPQMLQGLLRCRGPPGARCGL